MMKKIIIDVDTGIDDALALILAVKKFDGEILGITTCGGNVPVAMTTKNTLGVLSLLESDINVYPGSDINFENEEFIHAFDYHGKNGLCNIELPQVRKAQIQKAEDFIINSVKNYPDLTIVCLAPMTNIAKAISSNPDLFQEVSFIVMGGAVNIPGNQTKWAEFNFYQDPKAVQYAFRSIKKIKLVSLDVTQKCLIEKEDLSQINDDPIPAFFKQAVTNWYDVFPNDKNRFFELYDPLAISVLLEDFITFKEEKFQIVTHGEQKGAIIEGSDFKINYSCEVKQDEFKNYFLSLF